MERVVEIDINSKEDLFEQYNGRKISKSLINYLINTTPRFKKDDTLKVIVYNNMKEDISCAEFIKMALDAEITSNDYKFMYTNRRQIVLLVLGVLILALATIVDIEIIKEIILIGAWVLLWEMVELEIDDDISNRRKRKVLKKLVASEFEEIKK